jgi:hypothetical protein
MPKSTAEMLKALEKLIDEYLEFQRGRPDLPQGNLCELSEHELAQIVTAFQLHKSEQEAAGQMSDLRVFTDSARRQKTDTALAPNRFNDFWRVTCLGAQDGPRAGLSPRPAQEPR